jgi:hypothetical protein
MISHGAEVIVPGLRKASGHIGSPSHVAGLLLSLLLLLLLERPGAT